MLTTCVTWIEGWRRCRRGIVTKANGDPSTWKVKMLIPLAYALLTASAQDPILTHNTFASSSEGWMILQPSGSGAKLDVTHDPAHTKIGTGSLQMAYSISSGQFSAAIRPVGSAELAGMNSLHFWVQADHDTTLVVSVQEHGEGTYTSMFQAKKGKWQDVDLSISDFALSTDANSPKDPDGKLDPEKIESIAIADFDEFMIQDKHIAEIMGISGGARTVFISDFTTSRDKLPDNFSSASDSYLVDAFSRPQISWTGVGLQSIDIVSGAPFPGKFMKLAYNVGPLHIAGVIHPTLGGALVGKKTIHLQVAANTATKIDVQIEQTNGGKYNSIVDVPGMAKLTDMDISLDSLMRAQDSTDPDTKPHLDLVKQILILDVSGVAGGPEQDNTLWVGPIDFKS